MNGDGFGEHSAGFPLDEDDAAKWLGNRGREGRPGLDVLVVIALGGVIGAMARYGVSQAVPLPDSGFPLATLLINLLGSYMLGVLVIVGAGRGASTRFLRPFLAVGVIGSFTTFSAFAVENVVLVDRGDVLIAATYVPVTLVGGLAAARLGIETARRLSAPERRAGR